MKKDKTPNSTLMTRLEVLQLLKVCHNTFDLIRRSGNFPKPIQMDAGGNRYLRTEVEEYLQRKKG